MHKERWRRHTTNNELAVVLHVHMRLEITIRSEHHTIPSGHFSTSTKMCVCGGEWGSIGWKDNRDRSDWMSRCERDMPRLPRYKQDLEITHQCLELPRTSSPTVSFLYHCATPCQKSFHLYLCITHSLTITLFLFLTEYIVKFQDAKEDYRYPWFPPKGTSCWC